MPSATARMVASELHRKAADADSDVEAEDQSQRVAAAEAAVDSAKEQHAMVNAVVTAIAAHNTATRYSQAAHALGPRGPRGDMIAKGLKRLGAGLTVLWQVAQWPPVEVEDSGQVKVAGRPVELCSESEKWRAQAAIQLTVAALDRSGLVVLDRADVLDDAEPQGAGRGARARLLEDRADRGRMRHRRPDLPAGCRGGDRRRGMIPAVHMEGDRVWTDTGHTVTACGQAAVVAVRHSDVPAKITCKLCRRTKLFKAMLKKANR